MMDTTVITHAAAIAVGVSPSAAAEKKKPGQPWIQSIGVRCIFCEGAHKSEDYLHRVEFATAPPPVESQPKYDGFIGSMQRNLRSGMIVSVGKGSTLTANVTIQHQDEFCVDDSGVTEHMTQGDYELAPLGQLVEGSCDSHLPIAGYRRQRPLVDNEVGDVHGPARDLALKRVALVPNLG